MAWSGWGGAHVIERNGVVQVAVRGVDVVVQCIVLGGIGCDTREREMSAPARAARDGWSSATQHRATRVTWGVREKRVARKSLCGGTNGHGA